ncbi:MAG TPA: 50S ribosomal protein L24 [Candidatus Paceibacterota bacterium]
MKIKKGDNILVIAGKDRGRKGKVIRALPQDAKIVVEGIHMQKKHVRAKKAGEKGQIIEMPLPVNVSSVKIVCGKCQKATRVGYRASDGKKSRICKKCGAEL